jgi:hypothetical protein
MRNALIMETIFEPMSQPFETKYEVLALVGAATIDATNNFTLDAAAVSEDAS